MKKLFVVLSIMLLLTESCSKEKRIKHKMEGTWDLVKLLVDGVDSTSKITHGGVYYRFDKTHGESADTYYGQVDVNGKLLSGYNSISTGDWSPGGGKNEKIIYYIPNQRSYSQYDSLYCGPFGTIWAAGEIINSTCKEVWLQIKQNDEIYKKYEYHLKKRK